MNSNDRKQLIRLAADLEKGSPARRTILDALQKNANLIELGPDGQYDFSRFHRKYPYYNDLDLIWDKQYGREPGNIYIGTGRFEIPKRKAEEMVRKGLVEYIYDLMDRPYLEMTRSGKRYHDQAYAAYEKGIS